MSGNYEDGDKNKPVTLSEFKKKKDADNLPWNKLKSKSDSKKEGSPDSTYTVISGFAKDIFGNAHPGVGDVIPPFGHTNFGQFNHVQYARRSPYFSSIDGLQLTFAHKVDTNPALLSFSEAHRKLIKNTCMDVYREIIHHAFKLDGGPLPSALPVEVLFQNVTAVDSDVEVTGITAEIKCSPRRSDSFKLVFLSMRHGEDQVKEILTVLSIGNPVVESRSEFNVDLRDIIFVTLHNVLSD